MLWNYLNYESLTENLRDIKNRFPTLVVVDEGGDSFDISNGWGTVTFNIEVSNTIQVTPEATPKGVHAFEAHSLERIILAWDTIYREDANAAQRLYVLLNS